MFQTGSDHFPEVRSGLRLDQSQKALSEQQIRRDRRSSLLIGHCSMMRHWGVIVMTSWCITLFPSRNRRKKFRAFPRRCSSFYYTTGRNGPKKNLFVWKGHVSSVCLFSRMREINKINDVRSRGGIGGIDCWLQVASICRWRPIIRNTDLFIFVCCSLHLSVGPSVSRSVGQSVH